MEKRKKGKVVTVIRGLPAASNDLPALLSQLKSQCGAGARSRKTASKFKASTSSGFVRVLTELSYVVRLTFA